MLMLNEEKVSHYLAQVNAILQDAAQHGILITQPKAIFDPNAPKPEQK